MFFNASSKAASFQSQPKLANARRDVPRSGRGISQVFIGAAFEAEAAA